MGMKIGSTGEGVKELQRFLGFQGDDVDGIYGPKTESAMKNYQKNNGLVQTGYLDEETKSYLGPTLSSMLGDYSISLDDYFGSTGSKVDSGISSKTDTKPTFNPTKSDAVLQAEAMLQQHIASKPGEWQGGTWTDQINDTINQILNREEFSYDLNKDALYQQYADQYTTRGKLASMDVMGQAAAMTGGYGNSFAQTAGQQAYQGYLQQLNDVVPELYGMALDQHNQEVQNLYTQAGLMAQMDDQEYGRYQDKLSQYYTDLNYLTENARYMSETEYQKALDDFNIKYSSYWDQTNFDYTKEQDKIANDLSQSSMGGDISAVPQKKPDADGIPAYDDSLRYSDYNDEAHSNWVKSNGGSYYQQVLNDLKVMKGQSKSNSYVYEYLQKAVGNSFITKSEYMTLYNKYRDNRL